MNKKTIKYLLWIILITSILILMPMNKSNATFTINYYGTSDDGIEGFSTNKNLFCLNKGDYFGDSEEFDYWDIQYDAYDNICYGGTLNGKSKYVIEYIASSIGPYTKYNTSNYIPQRAIWELTTNRNIF